jgi:hypothetical protein
MDTTHRPTITASLKLRLDDLEPERNECGFYGLHENTA